MMWSKTPVASVILPTYNRSHLIGRAITGVLNQTHTNFELIIVDDASTDDTQRVVESFADSRIRYIRHECNKGAAAARNSGIRASRGHYIAFQDSDDEWAEEKLARQVSLLDHETQQVGGVYASFWRINGRQKKIVPSPIARWISLLPLQDRKLEGEIYPTLLRGNIITPQTVLIRRECFDRVGVFDERMSALEDWDLWLRIAQQYQFRYIADPLATLYYTSDSISTNREALIQALELLLEKHVGNSKKNNTLLAHYFYALGDLLYQGNEPDKGRSYLYLALRYAPFNALHWLAMLLSLCGQSTYTKIIKTLGFSYAR